MSKIRREEQHAAIREEIKSNARRLMEREGTAGISMRGIGREMDMTAAALYYYYPSRDALITDLILDAFNALADYLEQCRNSSAGETAIEQLRQVLFGYREWALAHPIDFQLIYGNPIPAYEAPSQVTTPAATRNFVIIGGLLARAMQAPGYSPREKYDQVPEELEPYFQELGRQVSELGADLPPLSLYLTTVGWPQIHGLIMLELFNHIQPVVWDVGIFYGIQIENMMHIMGFKN